MATALINFGALVAFTFVNLSVISQFWIREKRNKTLKITSVSVPADVWCADRWCAVG